MKNKTISIILLTITLLSILSIHSKASSSDLYLNNLDFNAKINSDGSMNVVETWNIKVKNTNTLYKSFKTDNSKYSSITDVKVKEINGRLEKDFDYTDKWAYHVTKGSYYGTKNQEGDFEIGWGVGLDSSTATKKYQISYKVNDAISKYSDYAELYWQFVGNEFRIDASKITGTVLLPSKAKSKDEIKVWGHTEDLNGEIYATDLNKIEFTINSFRNGRFVEIRSLFPTKMITSASKTYNTKIYDVALEEETAWANLANARRASRERGMFTIIIAVVIANGLVAVFLIKKVLKYRHQLSTMETKFKPEQKLKYYRDLPDENATPSSVHYLLKKSLITFSTTEFGKIFSATMLDLSLKNYIEVSQDEDKKIKLKVYEKDSSELKEDEQKIYNYIKDITNGEEVTVKELQKAIKRNPSKVENLLDSVYNKARKINKDNGNTNEKNEEEFKKSEGNKSLYRGLLIFALIGNGYIYFQYAITLSMKITIIAAFAVTAIMTLAAIIMSGKVSKRINRYTQKGVNEIEQWNGLKNYMNDFSMLDKREVPELVLWEKYLVYATLFGIADKVIKQLKTVFPNMEEIINTNDFILMNMMMHTDFDRSFSNAISSTMSTTYSSANGGGGGFSGGGGFGRRRRSAAGGR